MVSSSASACPQDESARSGALRTLYSDADLVRYVCVENSECSFSEFSEQLDVKTVDLNGGHVVAPVPGLQVEPLRKGRQYFSAVFARNGCNYELVFAPDTAFSDLKILKEQKNGFFLLRAVEPCSDQEWKEYDFTYDPSASSYSETRTRCYRVRGAKRMNVKCDW
jgi:hypothetical protein